MAKVKKEIRVNVYEDPFSEGPIIARVRYNNDLDYWDGSNWSNGGVGRHKGITKLKDGRFVLIIGTEWIGEKDFGYIITPEEALQEIIKSGNVELLERKKYLELKKLLQEKMIEEEEEEE